jgi:hypothetical protein
VQMLKARGSKRRHTHRETGSHEESIGHAIHSSQPSPIRLS